jgi:hypothetical protein
MWKEFALDGEVFPAMMYYGKESFYAFMEM